MRKFFNLDTSSNQLTRMDGGDESRALTPLAGFDTPVAQAAVSFEAVSSAFVIKDVALSGSFSHDFTGGFAAGVLGVTPHDGLPRTQSANAGITGASAPGLTARLTEYQENGTWHFTGNQDIDAVLFGSKWATPDLALTYSFPVDNSHYNTPYYNPDLPLHQVPLNAAQQLAAQYAFGLLSSYTGLTFTQVTETDTVHGNIRISQTSSSQELSAEGNFPGSDASDGDIWIGQNNQPFYLTPQIGNWGQSTMMHEIGHTMGLKHGHDDYTTLDLTVGGYVDGPGPFYGTAALPHQHDGQAWSLMTYRSDPDNDIIFEGDEFDQPQTYMQDDIAALQYLYGANFTTNATDSVYTVNATTGEMFINGVSQGDPDGNKVFRTVWDGNGNDTYNFDNFTGDQSIDLRAGGWSTFNAAQLANNRAYSGGVHYAPGNIANALEYQGNTQSLIENAIGGSGNDKIVGNEVSNTLTGNDGNDLLDGGAGADNMIGGAGDDTYFVDNAADFIQENPGQGNDTIATVFTIDLNGTNIENAVLLGSADINATGTNSANVLVGNSGVNVLTGGIGNDTLDGGAGADTMIGGAGADSYYVDNIGDVITEASGEGADTVNSTLSFTLAANLENLNLLGGANIDGTGNSVANIITGNGGNNILMGGGGTDTLNGGLPNGGDILDVGLPVHNNIATALAINYADFSRRADANIENSTTVDHATVISTGDGTYRMYAIAVTAAGVVGTFDIDNTVSLDTFVRIYNAGGTLIVSGDDDNNLADGGGGSTTATDSFFHYTFTAGGTYYVEVAAYNHNPVPTGTGFELNISLAGNGAPAGANADTLDGGTGADTMTGGAGDDTYVVDNVGDNVVEVTGEGDDTINSSVTYSLSGRFVETLNLTGSAAINATGNSLDNTLTGNSGVNTLDGGSGNDSLDGQGGADIMKGSFGNDVYHVDNTADQVIENASQGNDSVNSTATFTLSANVEALFLEGAVNIDGTGNTLDNAIYGNAGVNTLTGLGGNDHLDGQGGADILKGGTGDDAYYVDNTGDNVIELDGEGNDVIYSQVTYSLAGRFVETLTLSGAADINATGNGHDNQLYGNLGANTLDGGAGNDNLDGGVGADIMKGGSGDDTYHVDNVADQVIETSGQGSDIIYATVSYGLAGTFVEILQLQGIGNINATGNSQANQLYGNDGNNVLDGGVGADSMYGGLGNDTYIVDNAGDALSENPGEGIDTVKSSLTFALGANFENLTLTGSASINATGNSLNNIITGNSGNNIIDGSTGADTMSGLGGNDTYYVDDAGDTVSEGASGGTDIVYSAVTFTLAGQQIENLTLMAAGNLNATGNSLANIIMGNGGDNVINGGFGADSMKGGAGNDTYYVDNAGDTVTEGAGAGTDIVFSSVTFSLVGQQIENLTINGTSAVNATGNSLANILIGNNAANTIDGGFGADTLTGQGGADIFLFGSSSGADTITDFSATQNDSINVNAYTHGTAHTAFIVQVGGDVHINLGGSNVVTVTAATVADVTAHMVW